MSIFSNKKDPLRGDIVSETHDEINAIMDGERKERNKLLDQLDSKGNEPFGSVKTAINTNGVQTIYRKQKTGKWAPIDSNSDTWKQDLTDLQDGDILDSMDNTQPTQKKQASLIPNAEKYLDENLNVLLVGLHGTGKTVSIMDLARQRGMNFKYYSCSTLDPYTDLVGVPTPRDYCPACKLYFKDQPKCPECSAKTVESLKMVRPREVDEAEIIFFDEFNRADSKTQNALFEIMQFKSINGDPLPNLKACWAAINPPDDEQNYQVEPLDPALLDRFDLYIEITPKPSVAYMSQHMPQPIAAALKVWWDAHQDAINRGAKDKHTDYVSPRRLEKIGLVWCATKATRSVHASLPMGGSFEKTKLIDMLKAAQQQVDKDNGLIDAEPVDDEDDVDLSGDGLGDRPASSYSDGSTIIYRLANMRLDQQKLADYLTEHPGHHATHEKVVEQLRQGVGGEELVLKYGKILNSLIPSSLEGLVSGFPNAKVNQMRQGFIKLYNEDTNLATTFKALYKVLDDKNFANWPSI